MEQPPKKPIKELSIDYCYNALAIYLYLRKDDSAFIDIELYDKKSINIVAKRLTLLN